jgi:hypothetical protein
VKNVILDIVCFLVVFVNSDPSYLVKSSNVYFSYLSSNIKQKDELKFVRSISPPPIFKKIKKGSSNASDSLNIPNSAKPRKTSNKLRTINSSSNNNKNDNEDKKFLKQLGRKKNTNHSFFSYSSSCTPPPLSHFFTLKRMKAFHYSITDFLDMLSKFISDENNPFIISKMLLIFYHICSLSFISPLVELKLVSPSLLLFLSAFRKRIDLLFNSFSHFFLINKRTFNFDGCNECSSSGFLHEDLFFSFYSRNSNYFKYSLNSKSLLFLFNFINHHSCTINFNRESLSVSLSIEHCLNDLIWFLIFFFIDVYLFNLFFLFFVVVMVFFLQLILLSN